jgi:hypothetical protein
MNLRLTTSLAIVLAATSSMAAEFYVAPSGADTNSGSREKPFATLERARDAARKDKGSTVFLADGTYRRTKTFELDQRDSGTVFKAFKGASPRVVGSVAIPATAVKKVTAKAILERLVPEVRDQVLEIDLHALGIKDFGDLGPRGFRRPVIPAPLELFINDLPLNIARWPNPGTPGVPMGKVFDKGSVTRNGEKPTRGGTFSMERPRPERWTHAKDVWITGLFENGYADNTVKVKEFDLMNKKITTVHPHMYGFSGGHGWNRWVALNLLEEIDIPGEYMADKESGKVYFLPNKETDLSKSSFEVSIMKEPLVAIEGATGVVFDGVNFENARGMGVYIERGADNRIENATLRNFGMVAICIGKGISPDPDYQHAFTGTPASRVVGSLDEHFYNNTTYNREAGTGQSIRNCHIYNIGAGAISLGGGDRKTLTPANNSVENCEIHDFNRWDRTYRTGVNIDGVGNRIAHCLIYNAPGTAIYLHGNEHVIEYNEIHHVMTDGDDMGAFYMGRDASERGTVIRYNYFHESALHHMTFGLYFDDSGGDGAQVYGNVFRKFGNAGTVFVCGGSDFLIENNLFVDCKKPTWLQAYRPRVIPWFKERFAAVNYTQEPWVSRYPEMKGYFESKRPHNNRVEKNLIVKGDDPRLIDPANGNYGLKPGAETGIDGFKPIPFEQIGLVKKKP